MSEHWKRDDVALRVRSGRFDCAGGSIHLGSDAPSIGTVVNVVGDPTGCGCHILDFGGGVYGNAARYRKVPPLAPGTHLEAMRELAADRRVKA